MKKVKAGIVAGKAGINLGAAIAGTLAGAAIGKPSLGIGVVSIIGGAYLSEAESGWGTPLMVAGAGMVASNGMPNKGAKTESETKGLAGLQGWGADAKERFKIALRSLGEKTYIPEKVFEKIPGFAGLGNASATYHTSDGGSREVSEAEVNRILRELNGGTDPFQMKGVNGGNDVFQMKGMGEMDPFNLVG